MAEQPFQVTSATPTPLAARQQQFARDQALQQRLLTARNEATQRIEATRQQYAQAEANRQADLRTYAAQVEDRLAGQQQELDRMRTLSEHPGLRSSRPVPTALPSANPLVPPAAGAPKTAADMRGLPVGYYARGGVQHLAPGGPAVGGPVSPRLTQSGQPNIYTWGQLLVRQYTSPNGEPRHQILDASGAVQGDYADSDPNSPVTQNPSGPPLSQAQQVAQSGGGAAPYTGPANLYPPAPAAPTAAPPTGPVMSNVPGMSQENLDALNAKTAAKLAEGQGTPPAAPAPTAPPALDPAYEAAVRARQARAEPTLQERQQRQFDENRAPADDMQWGRFARGGTEPPPLPPMPMPMAPGAAPLPGGPGGDAGPAAAGPTGGDMGGGDPNAIVGEGKSPDGSGEYRSELVIKKKAFDLGLVTVAQGPTATNLDAGDFVVPLAPHLEADAEALAQPQPGMPAQKDGKNYRAGGVKLAHGGRMMAVVLPMAPSARPSSAGAGRRR